MSESDGGSESELEIALLGRERESEGGREVVEVMVAVLHTLSTHSCFLPALQTQEMRSQVVNIAWESLVPP